MLEAFSAVWTLIGQMARRRRMGIVVLYHRIAPSAGDPSTELVPAVSASTFRRQMRWLRRFFRVVPAGTRNLSDLLLEDLSVCSSVRAGIAAIAIADLSTGDDQLALALWGRP